MQLTTTEVGAGRAVVMAVEYIATPMLLWRFSVLYACAARFVTPAEENNIHLGDRERRASARVGSYRLKIISAAISVGHFC